MKHLDKLTIGSKAKLYGKDITIRGWISYKQKDDGKWYRWKNFYATSADGGEYWIDYDFYSKQFSFFKRIDFDTNAFVQSGKTNILTEDADEIRIVEQGVGTVTESEGTIPYDIQKQNTVNFIDAVGGKGYYSLEWDSQDYYLYKGQNIDEIHLFKAFGFNDVSNKLHNKRKARLKTNIIDTIVAAVLVLSLIGIFISHSFSNTVFEDSVTVCSGTGVCEEAIELETLEFESWPPIYEITLESTVPQAINPGDENWKSITLEFINTDGMVTNGFYYDLYSEYWVEGIESGVETKEVVSKKIRINEPGTYALRMEVESSYSPSSRETAKITVSKKFGHNVQFYILAGLGVVYLIFLRQRKKS